MKNTSNQIFYDSFEATEIDAVMVKYVVKILERCQPHLTCRLRLMKKIFSIRIDSSKSLFPLSASRPNRCPCCSQPPSPPFITSHSFFLLNQPISGLADQIFGLVETGVIQYQRPPTKYIGVGIVRFSGETGSNSCFQKDLCRNLCFFLKNFDENMKRRTSLRATLYFLLIPTMTWFAVQILHYNKDHHTQYHFQPTQQ